MEEKKFRKSGIVIALYVIAFLTLVYAFYLIGTTLSQVFEYYGQYGMAPKFGEVLVYILQAAYQPLLMVVLTFAAGYILNEVRALNPAYYATDAEIAEAKAAKKLAKRKTAVKAGVEKVEEAKSEAVVFEAINDKVEEKLDEGAEESEAIIDEVIEEVAEEAEESVEEAAEEKAE